MVDKPNESEFKNADGLKIYCKYWYPDNDVRALVQVIHGVGEHCARYDDIAASFTKLGCLVYGHDHVGHGRSEGTRVDIKDFQDYVRDCVQHTNIISGKHPGLPIIIYGHSMGGTVAILTMNSSPERYLGAIFGLPCVIVDPAQATPVMIFFARAAAYMCPQLAVGHLDRSNLSRDLAVVEDYKQDPLVWQGGMKARMVVQIYDACQRIKAELAKATYPFLIQHGTKDTMCVIEGSEMFYRDAPSHSKVFKRYEGYFHELDKEPVGEKEIVFKDIEDWTKNLLDGSSGEVKPAATSSSDVKVESS